MIYIATLGIKECYYFCISVIEIESFHFTIKSRKYFMHYWFNGNSKFCRSDQNSREEIKDEVLKTDFKTLSMNTESSGVRFQEDTSIQEPTEKLSTI